MSTAQLPTDHAYRSPAAAPEPAFVYRRLSPAAVSCVVIGVFSALALIDWWLAVVPAMSLALGVVAWRQIRVASDELTGLGLVKIGLALSVLFWSVGWARLGYIHATEVPEGYQRINYRMLQPPRDAVERIPQSAWELDGQDVFIKGYVVPGIYQNNVRQFLLVRDQGDCCFGSDPNITERIQVTLSGSRGIDWSPGVFKLAGRFRIEPTNEAVDRPGGVFYHLDQAMVR